jgi:ubiquinone/menaquinone biosynthesis C-methylase UbiE
MLMTARENAEARNQVINILNSDAEFLPFKDKSFDIVLCLAVLHHMDDSLAEKVLAEACRVLRHGGLLVTDFRNKSNPILKYAYNKNSCKEFLLEPRTLKQVREQLRENGFKVSKIKGIGSPVLPPYMVLIGEKI